MFGLLARLQAEFLPIMDSLSMIDAIDGDDPGVTRTPLRQRQSGMDFDGT